MIKTPRSIKVLALALACCALIVVATTGGTLSSAEAVGPVPLSGYASEVTVTPSDKQPGAFLCKAALLEVATGRVLAGPAVLIAAGQPAETASDSADGADKYLFSVSVDSSASSVTYSLGIRRDGRVTTLHRGSVSLPRS